MRSTLISSRPQGYRGSLPLPWQILNDSDTFSLHYLSWKVSDVILTSSLRLL